MKYVTNGKIAIMGAAGAVGSNIAQSLLATGTAKRIAMYDPFAAGVEGAAAEIEHCAFPQADVTWTTNAEEALDGAMYVLSSGGAPCFFKAKIEYSEQLGKYLQFVLSSGERKY